MSYQDIEQQFYFMDIFDVHSLYLTNFVDLLELNVQVFLVVAKCYGYDSFTKIIAKNYILAEPHVFFNLSKQSVKFSCFM